MDIVWIRCVLTLEAVSFVSLCLDRKRYWEGGGGEIQFIRYS